MTTKPGNKTFLSTKNLTDDKLDIFSFKMINAKNTIVEFFFTKHTFFPQIPILINKENSPDIPLATIWNYSTKK